LMAFCTLAQAQDIKQIPLSEPQVQGFIAAQKDLAAIAGKIQAAGDKPDPALARSLSGENAVSRDTPPTFIFHTDADTAVPAENSVHYYLALRKAGVPAEMHIFEKGAHGVGLANNDAALSEWSKLMANWLRIRGVIR